MATTLHDVARPVADTLNQLLVGLGFAAEEMDRPLELAIDRFDQWNNPTGAMLACTTCRWTGTDAVLEQAA